jgi:hypothetical protein|tara:strand:- start:185 stop:343 length:159 start_codon:yes stop_codon:yes gene_type:complete
MKKIKHETVLQIFEVVEIALLSWIGFILLKIMFDFGAAMEAWSELDKIMRGY